MGKWYHWWMGWLATSAAIAWLSNDLLTTTFSTGSFLHIIAVGGGTILLGVSILFCHDRFQTVNPIQRRFPVLYWGRWVAVHLGPLFRQYWFANDLEEKPFDRVTRNWIYATSKGKKNTIGFGSQVDYDAVGTYTVMPAMFKRVKGEQKRYHRHIGKATGVGNPMALKHFINISAMSYGSLSANAVSALNQGAGKAGILHNTGEGGFAPYHQKGGDVIFQLGTGKFGCRDDNGDFSDAAFAKIAAHDNVRMIELKLMQGAKPGKGGILPKEKITAEIAAIRKVPIGQDILSPPRHDEFDDLAGMFDFIDRLRGMADKPVGIKIVAGHIEEIEAIAEAMAAEPTRGPDFISVDGGEGGTGAAPLVLASHAGVPMKQGLAMVDWALRKYGVRDRVHLFSSGQISTPIDVVVAMALGADGVNIARGFMLSLGCIQALDCNSNRCPTGIATQDKGLQRALDVSGAASRVANYVKTLEKEVYMLCHSCGYTSPDQFTADDIMVVTSPGHLDYLSELYMVSASEASKERGAAQRAGMTVGEMKTTG
jgi:glutamate synthase domain-containing protein 2